MQNYIVKNGDPYITSKILRYKPSEISKKKKKIIKYIPVPYITSDFIKSKL